MDVPFETFPCLTDVPGIRHAFTGRTTEDTKAGDFQVRALSAMGFDPSRCTWAEQTHGNTVAVVSQPGYTPVADGLVTRETNLPLVARCADCAAVYVVDRMTRVIGLAHSGKRGTLANMAGNMIATMRSALGARPSDCLALISPCIGPCHYEMDIAREIERQLRAAGVKDVHNAATCTACHLDRYFSYRAEKGQTGRMYAVLSIG
jgi:YfiH family protein